MAREKHIQSFTGGMNTVLAPRLMPSDTCHYILNCDVTSSAEGKVGVIKNVKGNVSVPISLPEGENRTIGVGKNEESNKMYFAVWNSNGYHSWYEFDYISLTTKLVIRSIVDTGGIDIFKWERGKLINSINIVNDTLLYWTMEGHPARKINITKAIEKSDTGYGNVILDEYTRAYKRAPAFAPTAEYFTNNTLRKNNLYRRLFKFAVRFIYDDNEYSTFSDFSRVAVPEEESVTGTLGVPLVNNGLYVRFPTGGMTVKKIELIMQSTTDADDVNSAWVSIMVFDKEVMGIGNNTEYTYEFYNDNTYLAIDQASVAQQQSDLPTNPKVQEVAYNTLVYGNFYDGFPAVKVDFGASVEYSDLFVPDGTANVPNSPFFNAVVVNTEYESGGFLAGGGWRKTEADIIVGPDVKSGNIFTLQFTNDDFRKEFKATLNDDAASIASKFRTEIANHPRTQSKGGYVGSVTVDGTGTARFRFKIWNNWNKDYIRFITNVVPVNYSTLKDTGNSVPNEKLGSSFRYAIRYENEDGKRSLAYGNNEIVSIQTINDLGGIKKVATVLNIKHRAPSWATRYSIVRTKNLSQMDYIQLLIQRVATATTSNGEEYHDLIIGSLFVYQQVHPNTTLNYEFKKGDRVRLIKQYADNAWTIPSAVVDYEILDYYEEYRYVVNTNITVDGTSTVLVDNPDPNNVGNNIIIDGIERTIVGVTGTGYQLDSNIALDNSSSSVIRPAYEIINRNGILRIKIDPNFPIDVNPAQDKFVVVEVYTPAQTFSNAEQENYYDIGYKFEIVEIDGQFYHRGNSQDQSPTQDAIVRVEGFDNYVRNRELITNTSATNPQSKVTSIEDPSYSDFYSSKISSLGRPTRLDDSRGEVHFEDRLIWSNNFIEDTKINGFNMFLSTNRVDYNDKYGSIQSILFYEGKLYIFKYLKTGWVPVLGNLIIDAQGTQLVGTSTKLLPDKMEYFLWEGGVGDNPESIVKTGNEIFGVSPTSQVIFDIGGAGLVPVSKIYGIDNLAREIISAASSSGAHIFGGIDRRKNQYIVMIEPYEKISYTDVFNSSNTAIVNVPQEGPWLVVSNPSNGILNRTDGVITYFPNNNFSGIDQFSYRAGSGEVRYVVVNVLSEDTQMVWHPDGEFCVVESGARTGYVGYSILKQFDNLSGEYTGLTKPNVPEDSDYIAPVEDLNKCPLGMEYVYLGKINRRFNNQTITFDIESVEQFNILAKVEYDFESTTISETGLVASGEHTLEISIDNSDAYLFIVVENSGYEGITEFSMEDAYPSEMNMNELSGLIYLNLDQSSIPVSHNNQFASLNINQCVQLNQLRVIRHELSSIDLSSNTALADIDVSRGRNLISLTIGNWSLLSILRIHECAFTADGYNPSFVNSVISNMNSFSVAPTVLQYGSNNFSGVQPSSSVVSAYNSLVNKGCVVIGKNPNPPTQVNLGLSSLSAQDFIDYTLTLDFPLSVSITVNLRGSYTNAVETQFIFESVVILAGESVRNGQIHSGYPIISYDLYIHSVTPNPAGGVTIIY